MKLYYVIRIFVSHNSRYTIENFDICAGIVKDGIYTIVMFLVIYIFFSVFEFIK